MDFVGLFGVNKDLSHTKQSRKDRMVGKYDIIEVNSASLVLIDEMPIAIVDRVESKACQIHSHEIEIHTFDTKQSR